MAQQIVGDGPSARPSLRERAMCLAVPGEVLSKSEKDGVWYGDVRFGGITREVCLHALPDVTPGEFVLVHVGFAIARVDRVEAERAWELLARLGDDAEIALDVEAGT
jgi:hydrogenase expression/formation protein HypC